MLQNVVNAGGFWLEQLLFPSVCVLCERAGRLSSTEFVDLCRDCFDELPWLGRACRLCAEPFPDAVPRDLACGRCLRAPPKFQRACCAFRYAYPVGHLIRAFKFRGHLTYGRVLAMTLVHRLRRGRTDPWPEIIVPVPLSLTRFRERGFNQANELGGYVGPMLGIPVRRDLVERTRATLEQTGLDQKVRRRNVRGAFRLRNALPARRIALLDDVLTTGSTADELARVLRRAGAKHIEVWAIAKTTRSNS